jgi:hypothetical protein
MLAWCASTNATCITSGNCRARLLELQLFQQMQKLFGLAGAAVYLG